MEYTLASDGKSALVKETNFGNGIPVKIISIKDNTMEAVTSLSFLPPEDTIIFRRRTGNDEKEEKELAEKVEKIKAENAIEDNAYSIVNSVTTIAQNTAAILSEINGGSNDRIELARSIFTDVTKPIEQIKEENLSNGWSKELINGLQQLQSLIPTLDKSNSNTWMFLNYETKLKNLTSEIDRYNRG